MVFESKVFDIMGILRAINLQLFILICFVYNLNCVLSWIPNNTIRPSLVMCIENKKAISQKLSQIHTYPIVANSRVRKSNFCDASTFENFLSINLEISSAPFLVPTIIVLTTFLSLTVENVGGSAHS